mgnify:CR=1 FL=1
MSNDDDEMHLIATFAMIDATIQTVAPLQIDAAEVEREIHQKCSRSKRRKYDHSGAYETIKADFLNPECFLVIRISNLSFVFPDKDFNAYWRII